MIKIFVSGFPLDISELELVMLVSPYGTVSTIKIVRDKKTGVCKGYAFLEMTDIDGARQVVDALDGTMFKGRQLTISVNETPVEKPVKNSGFSRSDSDLKKKRPRKRI